MTTDKYTEFQDEIARLESEVEHYQLRCDALKQINDSQVETIRTYAQIVKMMDVEINKLRGELI